MKSKLLLLSFLMLLTVTTNYAQTSATQSGIAVQGIARDNNNTALTNETISFKFTLYYNNPGPVNVYVENISISTDTFGVFSHVLDVQSSTNSSFANHLIFLKIEDVTEATIISDEVLKHVPYAISANNGVPTGSIMPYVGAVAPNGWVLCNGQSLTVIPGANALITLLGSNSAPNLGGMFLRGAGANTNPNVVNGKNFTGNNGPALNDTQDDVANLKSHKHGVTQLTIGDADLAPVDKSLVFATNAWGKSTVMDSGGTGAVVGSGFGIVSGDHHHSISGDTDAKGDFSETRPVNYGVNYIIKL